MLALDLKFHVSVVEASSLSLRCSWCLFPLKILIQILLRGSDGDGINPSMLGCAWRPAARLEPEMCGVQRAHSG